MPEAIPTRSSPPPPPSASRHPAFIALWLILAGGYLAASATGQRVLAMALVGLMVGALLVASGRFKTGLIAAIVLVGVCVYFSDSLRFVVYAPPLAAFAFMALFFYRTLRPGSEALITRVARMEHPDLPADMARYSRMLTWAWSLCFVLMFVIALLLTPFLALDAWSRWVQGLGYALPVVLFLGEHGFRHYRFRQRRHSSLRVLIANIITVCRDVALSPSAHNGKSRR
jgi:uncharacterized membrane protein